MKSKYLHKIAIIGLDIAREKKEEWEKEGKGRAQHLVETLHGFENYNDENVAFLQDAYKKGWIDHFPAWLPYEGRKDWIVWSKSEKYWGDTRSSASNSELHRDADLPAVESRSGTTTWIRDGETYKRKW